MTKSILEIAMECGIYLDGGPGCTWPVDLEYLQDFASKLREEAKAEAWQSIETAPKDGTSVVIATAGIGMVPPCEGYYVAPERRFEREPTHAGWWRCANSTEDRVHGRTPTHWQPLPPPPAQREGSDG